MIRILTALILAAPALHAQSLDGHWLNIGDPQGWVVPHYELLTLDGDRFESRAWVRPYDPDLCTGAADAPAACTPPVPTGAGRLRLDADRFEVVEVAGAVNPYVHPHDHGLWPQFALPGAPWTLSAGPRAFALGRPAEFEGERVALERLWLRVEADVPELLFTYLLAIERSLARAFCAVAALHQDEAAWKGFTADLRLHAPVAAEIAAFHDAPVRARTRERMERFAHLRTGQPLADGAATAIDHPQPARAAWLAVEARAEGAEAPPGQVWLAQLAWLVPQPVADRTAACEEHFFY